MARTGLSTGSARSEALLVAALCVSFMGSSLTGASGSVASARAQAPPRVRPAESVRPVEIVLDASGSMRSRMGDSDRMTVAREFVAALRDALAEEGQPPPLALRAYGSTSHRLRRHCTDTELLVELGASAETFDRALAGLRPLGVSPLAYALERAASDTATTYVLVTDGGDNCGGAPCQTWRQAIARAGNNRDLRLHVVAVESQEEEGRLRCLSRAGSGAFITITSPEEVGPAARRLALVLRNRGRIEVRLSVGEAGTFSAPVRLLRPRTEEVVLAFPGRRPRSVPAGLYTMVIETAPPIREERVMVLPGSIIEVERSDFGRLIVDLAGEDRRAAVSIRSSGERAELRYVRSGDPTILGVGAYDVMVDLGDSVVMREGLEVAEGETTRLVVGGSEPGILRVEAAGFEDPPPVRVLAYHQERVDTLAVGRAAEVPPGRYRLVVETLPRYVTENVVVDAGRTTTIALPRTGVLGVDLVGPEGPIPGVRVEVREPRTGESYGTFASGEPTMAMPGVFRIRIRTVPPIEIDEVRVQGGETRIVERRGLSRIVVSPAARTGAPPLRLEVFSEPEGRLLAQTTASRPWVAARPGSYLARVWRADDLLWEGSVAVAPEKTARIDWTEPAMNEAPR